MKQTETPAQLDPASLAPPGANGDLHKSRENPSGKPSKNVTSPEQLAPHRVDSDRCEAPAPLRSPAASGGGSLATGDDSPAFELKFLVDEERAAQVQRWAGQYMTGDAYGDPALGGAYCTTSLYCDTPELHVYHRAPWYRRRKFRIRSYGSAPAVFLERKSRRGDSVTKRRTSIAAGELSLLSGPDAQRTWPGYWFQRRLAKRRLGPACQIVYQRTAFVSSNPQEALRLTLDRQVHGSLTDRWCMSTTAGGLRLLTDQVILELKFRSALPVRFKQLIAAMNLNPTSVSKYRLCRDAWLSTNRAAERGNA